MLVRTLVGHELGVWAVNLVSAGGGWLRDVPEGDDANEKEVPRRGLGMGGTSIGGRERENERIDPGRSRPSEPREGLNPGLDHLFRHNRNPAGTNVVNPQGLDGLLPPSLRIPLGLDAPKRYLGKVDAAAEGRRKQDDVCGSSEGWGQPNALVVSGGCDKMVRVWDLKSGWVTFPFYVFHRFCWTYLTDEWAQALYLCSSRSHLNCAVSEGAAQSTHCSDWLSRLDAQGVECPEGQDAPDATGSYAEREGSGRLW